MTLDSSVMNVSIATVAKDVGTTVTGIQTAITLYTLVMAAFMITGGKIGEIIGRRKAFSIGCVIYGCGSLTTALAPTLPVLILGWSILEGLGAALIMPAIVVLVASNFDRSERPRAYGLVASAGAIAVAAGPLIGGLFTTYASWRWVFAGEVIVVIGILALSRRMAESALPDPRPKLDLVGTALSATGLALIVFGVLKSGEYGWVQAKAGAPEWIGLSPVVWLLLAGAAVLWVFLSWEQRLLDRGQEPLVDPALLKVPQLRAGLSAFFFQYFVQAGLFFTIPLFLSVAVGLSAIATGVRLLPLSATLLLAAVLIPRLRPQASPRRVRAVRVPLVVRCARRDDCVARHRCRARDRHLADAARGLGYRCARVATRRGHGLGRERRRDRSGRRVAEHDHQPRRVAGDRSPSAFIPEAAPVRACRSVSTSSWRRSSSRRSPSTRCWWQRSRC